jgi:hypothetical protein
VKVSGNVFGIIYYIRKIIGAKKAEKYRNPKENMKISKNG